MPLKNILLIFILFCIFLCNGCGGGLSDEEINRKLTFQKKELKIKEKKLKKLENQQGLLRSIFNDTNEVDQLQDDISLTKSKIADLNFEKSDKGFIKIIEHAFKSGGIFTGIITTLVVILFILVFVFGLFN